MILIPTNVTFISTFHSFFLAQKHCMSTHNAHLFLIEFKLDGKFQVNTNYWVGIRIPTNVTFISTFHSFFFGTKALYVDSQCSYISHRSELDGRFQVNTNYWVGHTVALRTRLFLFKKSLNPLFFHCRLILNIHPIFQ